MLITRRVLLSGTVLTITAASLTGCASTDVNIFQINQDGQFFTSRELTVLSDVAEIMIPRTDTPGAIDAQVATVIDSLMMTWAGDQTKGWFKDIIKYFDELSLVKHSKKFDEIPLVLRSALIEKLDADAFSDVSLPQKDAYKHLKYIVFRAYYTSEEASHTHVSIPGLYNGNLTLDEYDTLMKERAHG